jgi:flagellar M-ring protein FliF
MRGIELVVMGLLGLVVILVVLRPLVRRILTPEQRPALSGANARASLAAGAEGTEPPPADPGPAITSQTAKMIDIAQVQGQVHAQSIQKVGELAQRNPHETVSIIREWLQEPTN